MRKNSSNDIKNSSNEHKNSSNEPKNSLKIPINYISCRLVNLFELFKNVFVDMG